MRDIKLRAWDKERSKMIYKFDSNFDDNPIGYVLLQNEDGIIFCGNYLDNGDWNEPELMLCSGQYDKNLKAIYAKDILKKNYQLFRPPNNRISYLEITFDEGEFLSDGMPIKSKSKGYEIIGNYFENKNLLES